MVEFIGRVKLVEKMVLPKFDFHVHSSYSSDGEGTVAVMVEAAEARGLEAVAITDHGPELSVGISPDDIEPMLSDIELARRDAAIPVLKGIEANITDPSGAIDIDERMFARFDILLVGLHTLRAFSLDPVALARGYLTSLTNAMARQRADVITHPFHLHGNLARYLTKEDIDAFAKLAAERNIAIELNSKYHLPDDDFLAICLREGAKLSIGTDAHAPGEVGRVDWALATLRRIGAREEDLILGRFL